MLTLFSPAKANLFFKILFKRKDGYHEIASLFQTLNFGDILTFSLSNHKKDEFTSEGIQLTLDFSQNLIGKALFLFRNKIKKDFFVKIHLQKRIPLQSGLGGGSSNAATTLLGLNCLLGNPLEQVELLELAEQLGSDVPFFFSSGSAYCEGRGEKFKDVNISEEHKNPFYLAFPDFGLSTKEVFGAFETGEKYISNTSKNKLEKFRNNDSEQALLSWQVNEKVKTNLKTKTQTKVKTEIIFNDLEDAAFQVQPKLKVFKKQLLELGFSKVSMTGSGSSFLCFEKPEQNFQQQSQSEAQLKNKPLDLSNSKISLQRVEMLQRNSASWYPVCLWKKNSLLLPEQPVLSAHL